MKLLLILLVTFYGQVIAILDGDTIKVMKEGKEVKIRLAEIDCPEKSQAFGMAAKKFTSDLIFKKEVKIEYENLDQYGRIIGKVYLNDTYVNAEIVKHGYAWHYRQYSKNQILAEYETKARLQKIGLWTENSPIAPWEFRKFNKM
jgi:endonuclease YncB( thermonuclease family)